MSSAPPFAPAEYRRRLDALRSDMEQAGISAALIMHRSNLIYYTGLGLHAQLVVPLAGDPLLLVQVNADRARAESWGLAVRPSLGLKTVRQVLVELGLTGGTLGVELDVLPYALVERLRGLLAPGRCTDIAAAILRRRLIKSDAELAVLAEAAAVAAAGFALCRQRIRSGVTETALSAALYTDEVERGGDGWMRGRSWNPVMPHGVVVAGPNTAVISGYWMSMTGSGPSAALPYGSCPRSLAPGDLVVVDRGFSVHGYHVDAARTFVVGAASPRQEHCWSCLETILEAALAAVRPGAPVAAVYAEALRAARETGVAGHFMTRSVYDFDYLGHGVGLEIDEGPLVGPRAEGLLQPGMVLALEPKIIIPGWGGLTLEETLAVTPDGHRLLTRSPRHPLSVTP